MQSETQIRSGFELGSLCSVLYDEESEAEQNIDTICSPEYKYYYGELELKYHDPSNERIFISASAWKNSITVAIGGVEMLLSSRALKSLTQYGENPSENNV